MNYGKNPFGVRQNWCPEVEAELNRQINREFYISQVYLLMSTHFAGDDQALPGFSKLFRYWSNEEREHGLVLADYQVARGGQVVLHKIQAPAKTWTTALEAMEETMLQELKINQELLDLYLLAGAKEDGSLEDFIASKYLQEHVEGNKEVADMVSRLRRVGPGLGEHIMDRELLAKKY